MPLRSGGQAKDMRSLRVTTGSVAGGGSVDVTVTWPTPFADSNYTAVASIEEGTAGDSLRVRKVVSRAAGSVTVLVANSDALNARTGIVHVIAIHD